MLEYIRSKFPDGLIGLAHIGSHSACEIDSYQQMLSPMWTIWGECNPKIINDETMEYIAKYPNQYLVQRAFCDTDDQIVDFYILNEQGASSLLDVGPEMNKFYPNHAVSKKIKVETIRLDTAITRLNLNKKDLNVLFMDVQGGELLVLKGAIESVLENPNCKFVGTEVSMANLYLNGVQSNSLIQTLSWFGYKLIFSQQHADEFNLPLPQSDVLFERQ